LVMSKDRFFLGAGRLLSVVSCQWAVVSGQWAVAEACYSEPFATLRVNLAKNLEACLIC
jgi:hypothetical protein